MEWLEDRVLLSTIRLDSWLPGRVDLPAESDRFDFQITKPERVTVTVDTQLDGIGDLGGARVALVDSGNQSLAAVDVLSGEAVLAGVDLSAPGTYTIVVQAPGGDPNRIGDYELHLADLDPAAQSIGFGSSEPGYLDVRGRVQLFDLDVTADELDTPFTIALDGDELVHPVVELLGPAGTVVASGAFGPYTHDTRIAHYVAGEAGTYQIRVTAWSDTLGRFELGVSDAPVEWPQPLAFSTFTAGYLDRLADEDVFTFSGVTGQQVTVAVAGTGFTPDLILLGPNGLLAGTGDYDTLLRTTLPDDGPYVVLVHGGGAASLGNGPYLLSVSEPAPDVEPIAFGQRLPGTTHVPGDFAEYSLAVTAAEVGRPLSIVVSASSNYYFDQVLELYGPDGAKLKEVSTTSGYGYAFEIDDYVLPTAGTYRIRVHDYGDDETGSFAVGVSDQPTQAARALPAFDTAITGTIAPLGDVDDYTFTVAAGETVTIERLDGNFDLTLFGPDGTVVSGGGNNDSLLDLVTLPDSGTYTLRIEPSGGTVSGSLDDTGEYRVVVWKPTRTPLPIPIEFGQNQPGQVGIRGDIVDYSLAVSTAEVGKPVSIAVSASNNYYFDPVLALYGPDGAKLSEVSATSGYGYGLEIDDYVLPVAGTYRIRVYDYGNDETGSFTVGVSDQPIQAAPALTAFNMPITGAVTPVGDVDDYTFTAAAGETVTIERLAGNFDLTLFAPDGSVMSGGGNNDSFLDLVALDDTGSYTLRIEPSGGTISSTLDDTGNYSFAVWKPTRQPTPIPITFGQSRPGTVAIRGDVVEYSLAVTAAEVGKPVSIVVSASNNYYLDQVLELYGPGGEKLSEVSTTSGYGYAVEIDDYVLPAAGTYRIRVHDYGNDETGSFTVGVSDQPIESALAATIGSKRAGYLGPYGDVDQFAVQASTADPITVYVTAGLDLDTDLTVQKLDGTLVGRATSGRDSSCTFTPISGETYTLRVEPGGGTVHADLDDRGMYLLDISDSTHPAAYSDDETVVALDQGAWYAATIADAGDVDAYTFMASRGQRLRIAVATGLDHTATLRADVRLFNPEGILLASSTASTDADFKDFGLPNLDGLYRIEVSGRDSDVGPYVLGISDRTAEGANPIPLIADAAVGASLEFLSDEDAYQFSYTADSVISLSAASTDSACPLEMLVNSPVGSLLYYRTGTSVSLSETTLPAAGDYTVVLRAADRDTVDYWVDYTSRPAGTSPPPASIPGEAAVPITGPVYLEPRAIGTLPGETTTVVPPLPPYELGYDVLGPDPLVFDEIVVVQFPSGRGEQALEWDMEPGDVLDLVVEATSQFDSDLKLFDPSGVLLVTSSAGADSSVTGFRASATGKYRVVVSGSGEGGFAVSAWKRGGGSVVDLHLDDPAAAMVFHSPAEQHRYRIQIEEAETVNLNITPFSSSLLDTQLVLIGTFGQIIAADTSRTASSLNNVHLLAAGAYTVLVQPEHPSGGLGGYAIELSRGSTPSIVPSANPPIHFGESLLGSINSPGGEYLLSLDVTTAELGKPVSIVVSASSNYYLDQVLELYGPDGRKLTEALTTYGYGYALELDDYVLPVAGTYRIRVRDYGDDETGSFTVGVSDQPISTVAPIPAFNTVIDATIAPLGDVDDYTFTAAAGEIVTIERLSGGNFDLTLYGPDGSVAAGGGNDDYSLLDLVRLPGSGTYTLRIEPRGGTVSGSLDDTGEYRFAVWKPTRAPVPIPITFGQNQPGAVAIRGDVVEYSLAVTAAEVGRPVSIVVSASSNYYFDQVLELYGPDGAKLKEVSTTYGYGYVLEIDDHVLPAAGTYRIRVHDYGDDETGSFTVGVSDQPVTTATPLPAFNSPINGAITPVGDVDDYTLTAAAGEIVTIERLEGNFDLTLFGPDGKVVAGGGDNDSFLELLTLPAAGSYTLRIEPSGGTISSNLDNTGEYRFAVWKPTRAPVPIPIAFGENQSGQVVIRGDIVEYSLAVSTAEVGQPVSIVVSASSNYYFDQVLALYGPDGAKLTEVSTTYGYGYGLEIDDYVLPVAGTYRIRVYDYGNDETGSFTVGVSDQPVTIAPPLPAFDTPIDGAITPVGDVDDYAITATAGETVTIERLAGNFDLTLFGPDGSLMAGSGNNDSLLELVALGQTGTYTLRIEPSGGTVNSSLDDTGDYRFVVWKPTCQPVPIPITFGQSRPGTVAIRGDLVEYSLEVTAAEVGQPVSIVVSASSNYYFDQVLALYGPDGAKLTEVSTTYGYGYAVEIDDYVLPVAGTYRIRVYDYGNDETGSFTVGVSDQPIPTGSEEMPVNSLIRTSDISPVGDVDQFQFSALLGKTVVVRVDPITTGLDLDLTLLDSFGTVRQSVTSGANAELVLVVPADDMYSARVETGGNPISASLDNVGDYQISVTYLGEDAPGVLVRPVSGLTTTEAGGKATFTVVLNTQPAADVTIGLESSAPTEGTVAPTSLTFTQNNWYRPQTVVVTGVDDALTDGDVNYTIVTLPAQSDDPSYGGVDPPDVAVTNRNDDLYGITVSPLSGLITTEAGRTDTFTIVLDCQPAADVTIALSSSDPTEGSVAPASLVFTEDNWDQALTATVTGVNDHVIDGDRAYWIVTSPAASADTNYNGLDAANVAVMNVEGPWVVEFLPAGRGNSDVSTLDVRFNKPVRAGSFTAADLAVNTPAGPLDPSTFTVTPVSGNRYEVAIPTQSMEGEYKVVVGPDVTDELDIPMAIGSQTAVFTLDKTPPTISEVSPSGEVGFPVDHVDFKLSEAIDPDTLGVDDIAITDPQDEPIALDFVQPLGDLTYRVGFDSQRANGAFTLTIGPNIEDLAGNRMAAAFSAGFTIALPDMVVTSATVTAVAQWEDSIPVVWTVTNQGTGAARGEWIDRIYFSADASFNPLVDILASTRSAAAFSPLAASGQYVLSAEARVPTNLSPGDRYLLVVADAMDALPETRETNNVRAQTIRIKAPDLEVVAAPPPAVAQWGQAIPISWTVTNRGDGTASSDWTDQVYFSADPQFDSTTDILVASRSAAAWSPLASAASYPQAVDVTIPMGLAAGDWHVFVATDHDNAQAESDETNNVSLGGVVAVSLPPLPDLVVTGIVAPSTGLAGEAVTISWTLGNPGTAATAGPWTDQVYLSGDAVIGDDLFLGNFPVNEVIPAGTSLVRSQQITLPALATGSRWIVVRTDAGNAIFEQDEANNATVDDQPLELPARLRLSIAAGEISEGAGAAVTTATLSRNTDTGNALLIALASSAPSEASFPETVTIPAGRESIRFPLIAVDDHLVDGRQTITITASAAGYLSGTASVDVLDNDVPALTLTISTDSFAENAVNPAATATVTRNTPTTEALVVALSSDDITEATLPATVTIPADQTSMIVDVWAVDDDFVDESHRVTLTASATGFVVGSDTVEVNDNDVVNLSLVVADSRIVEGASSPATLATVTRDLVGAYDLLITLSSSDASEAEVPIQVTIPANQASATFVVNAGDDDQVDGPQAVTIRAQLTTPSGIVLDVGMGQATVEVLDNDGPTLTLAIAAGAVTEGGTVSGTVRRNTETTSALLVALRSDDTSEATVPLSVTIPAGASTADFVIAGVVDGITDGIQSAGIEASAAGFNRGAASIRVSDIDLPDLRIAGVTVPSSGRTGAAFSVTWSVVNGGVAPVTGDWVDEIRLSDDGQLGGDTLLGSLAFTGTLLVGQSYQQTREFLLPHAPGSYHILLNTDATAVLVEGSEANNVGMSQAIDVAPAYRATVATDLDIAGIDTPVPLRGRAFDPATGDPVPLKPVTVRVLVRGIRRVIEIQTDAQGNFATVFHPLPGEAGHYTIAADHPGVPEDTVQDEFVLVGLRAMPREHALRIVPNRPLSGQIELQNLADVEQSGIQVEVLGAPTNLLVQSALPSVVAASGRITLAYTLTATEATTTPVRVTLRVTSTQGSLLDIPLAVTIVPLVPELLANPGYLNRGMLRGAQTIVTFEVTNVGGAPTGDFEVFLPDLPWMSLGSPAALPSLGPGETTMVTLILSPDTALPLGLYQGNLMLSGEITSLSVNFQFRSISDALGDLAVTVVDEYTYYAQGAPKVAGATVTLRDFFDNTLVIAQGTTDAAGSMVLPAVREGNYLLDIRAASHGTYRAPYTLRAGITNETTIFLPRQLVTYSLNVVPAEIQDVYRIQLQSTFQTNVPAPVVTIEGPDDFPELAPGESTQIELIVTNHGLIAAEDAEFTIPQSTYYEVTPLFSYLGTIPARSSIPVPVVIRRRMASGGLAAPQMAAGDTCDMSFSKGLFLGLRYFVQCANARWQKEALKHLIARSPGRAFPSLVGWAVVVDLLSCLMGSIGALGGGGGGGSGAEGGPNSSGGTHYSYYGGGGGGGGSDCRRDPDVLPLVAGLLQDASNALDASQDAPLLGCAISGTASASLQADPGVCAEVRIQIDQRAVMTRAAFTGSLEVRNGYTTSSLEGVKVVLNIRDENGNPADDKFAIRGPVLEGLSAVDGTGLILPGASGVARYTFIPNRDAAPFGPARYLIGGTLRYIDSGTGQEIVVPLLGAGITVLPDPRLELRYFQQRDVYGDDPFTDEEEPSEPFALGLIVTNTGRGSANDFTITSSQPKIIENAKGLLIDFKIIGTQVGAEQATPSLTANLGDIEPGQTAVARWLLTSTLQGKFIDYAATFEHVDGLGDPRLSLIESVEIHELIHAVQADRAGDDNVPDFLVNDEPDPNNLPDVLYLSDGSVAVVNLGTNAVSDAPAVLGDLQVELLVTMTSGWNYVHLPDPGAEFRLARVVRSDGKNLRVADNVWQTDRTFPASETGARREHLLHLLDFDGTGLYTLYYVLDDSVPPDLVDVVDVTPDPRSGPVSSVDVVFSEPIDLGTFDYRDISLTRDGGANLISSEVVVSHVAGGTYRISGLESLTAEDAVYELTVLGSGIRDYGENAANGSASDTWAKGAAAPFVATVTAGPAFRNTVLTCADVVFSEPISLGALDYQDLSLTRDGGANLVTSAITIAPLGDSTYRINGLGDLTATEGTYVLTVNAAGVQDLDGLSGIGTKSVDWTMDTTAPAVLAVETLPTNPRNIVVQSIEVVLSEPIAPATFDRNDLFLARNGGANLIDQRVTVEHVAGSTYRIRGFNWVVGQEGTYTLEVVGSGVLDRAGNLGTGSGSETWVMDTTAPGHANGLAISPDRGISSSDGLTNTGQLVLAGTLGETDLAVRVFDRTTSEDLGYATVIGTSLSKSLDLEPGPHQLQVRIVDGAGNIDMASRLNQAESFFDVLVDIVQPFVKNVEVPSAFPGVGEVITAFFSEGMNIPALIADGSILTTVTLVSLSHGPVTLQPDLFTYDDATRKLTLSLGPIAEGLFSGDYELRLDGQLLTDTAGNLLWGGINGSPTSGQPGGMYVHEFSMGPPLHVVSLTPTASGFVAEFATAIDPSVLNLYDVETGIYGAPDVTLVGRTVGAIPGSLVVAGTTLTFVGTGGPLPADEYDVRLRSGAGGFKHVTSGVPLDGDGDLRPGGDYVDSFTCSSSGAAIVSLPDFTRGPGQPVDVPATQTGLPLRVSTGRDITSIELTVRYDPALLTITGATAGSDAPGAVVSVDTSVCGTVHVHFVATVPLKSGSAHVVTLLATVPAAAPYGAVQVLDITEAHVNAGTVPVIADDALHAVAYLGDSTGDRVYSGLDAQRIARLVVGLDSGLEVYRLIDPVILADVTGDGNLTGLDAVLVAREVVGLDPPEIPPLPGAPAGLMPGASQLGEGLAGTFGSHPGASQGRPEGEAPVPPLADHATVSDVAMQPTRGGWFPLNLYRPRESGELLRTTVQSHPLSVIHHDTGRPFMPAGVTMTGRTGDQATASGRRDPPAYLRPSRDGRAEVLNEAAVDCLFALDRFDQSADTLCDSRAKSA